VNKKDPTDQEIQDMLDYALGLLTPEEYMQGR